MSGGAEPRAGRRVLVVEDEVLLALTLVDHVAAFGWTVVGPYHDLRSALGAARAEAFDCAILDVNLNGQMVFPLAEQLLDRAIPFLFVTGYAENTLPEHLRAVPRVGKPYDGQTVLEHLSLLA
jgi:DNA-binding response OmpR family regulator